MGLLEMGAGAAGLLFSLAPSSSFFPRMLSIEKDDRVGFVMGDLAFSLPAMLLQVELVGLAAAGKRGGIAGGICA